MFESVYRVLMHAENYRWKDIPSLFDALIKTLGEHLQHDSILGSPEELQAVFPDKKKRLFHKAPTLAPPPPPLPPKVQEQLDKQANAYATSGVDIGSASPLLKMAMAQGAQQLFAPVPSQIVVPRPARISRSITSPSAARKLEKFISASGLNLAQFAGKAQADERTIRRFRKTGTVDKTVLARIAGVMNTSVEKLLE